MRTRIYTLHEKRGEVQVVSDGFDLGAFLLPPVWAVWHGLWLTLIGLVAVLAGGFLWSPQGPLLVSLGVSLVLGFEGGAVRRGELRLRRWRPAGVVEAGSAAGAEELWLKGEAV